MIAFLVIMLSVSGQAIAKSKLISKDKAVSIAKQELSSKPDSAEADLRSFQGKKYWIVSFWDDGNISNKLAVDAGAGHIVQTKEIAKHFGTWEFFAMIPSLQWLFVALLATSLVGYGRWRFIKDARPKSFKNLLIRGAFSLFFTLYILGFMASEDIGDTLGLIGMSYACVAFYAVPFALARFYKRSEPAAVAKQDSPAAQTSDDNPGAKSPVSNDGAANTQPDKPADKERTERTKKGGKNNPLGLRIRSPKELPNFKEIGGLNDLKAEIKATIGLLAGDPTKAKKLGIDLNGVLFYGKQGVGKTHLVEAFAGEYALNLVEVRVGDIIKDDLRKNIVTAFKTARDNAPCVLFFDDFDHFIGNKQTADWTAAVMVNTLIAQIEGIRNRYDILFVAATSDKDGLDSSILRPGRIDKSFFLPLPDDEVRQAIIDDFLKDKVVDPSLDTAFLVLATKGLSCADILLTLNNALLQMMQGALPGESVPALTQDMVEAALEKQRPRVKELTSDLGWDELILDRETKDQLIAFQNNIENYDKAAKMGIRPASGLLLYGPPGTGKTTIAKVMASTVKASFFSVLASDIRSKWVGEAEKNVTQLFNEARLHKPSIIFIDEIDALLSKREGASTDDQLVSMFLQQIDGLGSAPGVFVLGATNNLPALDPALLRGGRLSQQIKIPLPDDAEREALYKLHSRKLPLADDIDFTGLAARTTGMSGGDISDICAQAGMAAFERHPDDPKVSTADFDEAYRRIRGLETADIDGLKWEDLILNEKTKGLLMDFAKFIRDSDKLEEMGIEVPSGVLLYGPPGTGKTTIARVLSTETGASFFSIKCSDLESKWVGETEKNVAKLFTDARRRRPSIIFLDEIEALLPSRGTDNYQNSAISMFLQEIDGIGSDGGVFILGATNRPADLDPALLRSGRLSMHIEIPLPDAKERERLFILHARKLNLDDNIDLTRLVKLSDGKSGADIKLICQAAALAAFYEKSEQENVITMEHFEHALAEQKETSKAYEAPDWIDDKMSATTITQTIDR